MLLVEHSMSGRSWSLMNHFMDAHDTCFMIQYITNVVGEADSSGRMRKHGKNDVHRAGCSQENTPTTSLYGFYVWPRDTCYSSPHRINPNPNVPAE